ncbi:DUF2634 domain-containing protein [Alkalihalophilus marmarensis]|uniref:DUF2634 domain-containing protein n=1 Tax=Alkalihalophilus marmarensis TaxID=521377 RepID=UPI00203A5B68|nr:DUF2634 domain-containing protein [Alkalihalophilus marmarensis]MCM3488771.1 DUF2634 domain-containing protein [Alkalihalophilus marmarensis]
MKTLYLNRDGDLEFDSNGELKVVTEKDELIQEVRMMIQTNIGEWFLDPELGFDHSTVLVKQPDYEVIRGTITESILKVERVDRVDKIEFEFDRTNRTLSIHFVAISDDYGEIESTEVI